MKNSKSVKYSLNHQGQFIIEDYNHAKTFSNFFPGIAGLWGIPMWVFFVNRGQCIASFGIESKDKSILEFHPANKAYRHASLNGFRTFVKVKKGKKVIYWEPFQAHLQGTDFRKTQTMSMSGYDLTLKEKNFDLGLEITVNYFTVPQEPFSALVRYVTIKNLGKAAVSLEVIDGLPAIVPYGFGDWLLKHMSRTVEAWVKVRNLDNKAPFYQLNVEVADTPEVKHIKEGNFFFSFNPDLKKDNLLTPIVEAAKVFGEACDFSFPEAFLSDAFSVSRDQKTSNRTPCAMSYAKYDFKSKKQCSLISLFGFAHSEAQLNQTVGQAKNMGFISNKAEVNKNLIEGIRQNALTNSSSARFNFYSTYTFLDNILRGGLPVTLKSKKGNLIFNVYSRKHGDPERDYNFFTLAPTYYSQGNGNYRDVNQNRRNDVWFNTDVKDNHILNFFNFSQADGYNPLVVKGTSFLVKDAKDVEKILKECCQDNHLELLKEFLSKSFLPGKLLTFLDEHHIHLKMDPKEFLMRVLEVCEKQELCDHGEGFWTDHWTYNLDLIESYLALYPDELENLLLKRKNFHFYLNSHYVLPRDQRYISTARGVRQYKSVFHNEEFNAAQYDFKIREKKGEGAVYTTHLIGKLLCLIVNKAATFDPSGVGIEMEADKPNWYDALNGLPGLLGSSVSETLELKRFCVLLLDLMGKLSLDDNTEIFIFEELANFLTGLTNLLTVEQDGFSYWSKSNDIKENYRQRIRPGIEGKETALTLGQIKNFLNLVVAKTNKAFKLAKNDQGFLATYFYHQVEEYKKIEKGTEKKPFVRPTRFVKHALPLFLEGYVHALKVQDNKEEARKLYKQVRESQLFDRELKMYKVNENLASQSEEIGRTRIFPRGWLENESIWLHMEYKFLLELLRCELYEEFYENFKTCLIPFLNPVQYGRSILENSSFIVSNAHEDKDLHGRGFVARLSGSTAEFLHMWLWLNVGKNPFSLNAQKELTLSFKPALEGWLFTDKKSTVTYIDKNKVKHDVLLPANTYAFMFLGSTLVVYHNPKRGNTFGPKKVNIKKIDLTFFDQNKPVSLSSSVIPPPYSGNIRENKISRIDVYFG